MILYNVTPYAGVWIEIGAYSHGNRFYAVTPYAGVWIEIARVNAAAQCVTSHSLRGSVD